MAFTKDNDDDNNSKYNVSRYYDSNGSAKQIRFTVGGQIRAIATLIAVSQSTEHPNISCDVPGKTEEIYENENEK